MLLLCKYKYYFRYSYTHNTCMHTLQTENHEVSERGGDDELYVSHCEDASRLRKALQGHHLSPHTWSSPSSGVVMVHS